MKKMRVLSAFLCACNIAASQVVLHADSLVAMEYPEMTLCYNNSSMMAGNSIGDRYLVCFNADTIFLDVKESGSWTRKTAHIGTYIKLATLALRNDTIWLCWKESASVRTRFSTNRGDSWSSTVTLSPAGNASAPAIYAASNGKIHFVWFNEAATDTTVQHTVYSNGVFLSLPNTLSTPGYKASWPCVTAIGDTVLCSWKETHGNSKIYVAHSYNGGTAGSWITSAVANAANTGKDPSLSWAYDESDDTHYVYLAYDGTQKIYLQRSSDLGVSWSSTQIVSNTDKNSQFAKVEANNEGFVGVSWEHRATVSLYDDTKKDVGFSYSTSWADSETFGNDSMAYTYNPFGAPLTSLNKIDEHNFYLVWLSNDTVVNRHKIYERRISIDETNGLEEKALTKVRIYPNPASVSVTIENGTGGVRIYAIQGKLILETLVHQSVETLDISSLPNGVYLMQTGNAQPEYHRIVVQH